MKLTNNQVIQLYDGLTDLREHRSEALPIKISFPIIKNLKLLEPLYTSIKTAYNDLIMKYGEPNEKGEIFVGKDNIAIVNEELNTLGQIENTVDLDKIPLSSLENLSFSLKDMDTMYVMIDSEA